MNRLPDLLDRLSRPARMRYAEDVFLTGRAKLRDRLVSSAYFTLSTPAWGSLADDASHLLPFVTALDRLVGRAVDPRLVVDVGTGAGASAALAAERWPEARVEGIDTSWRMVRRAARRHPAGNLTFRRGSALALPYGDGTVDLVLCVNAIVVPSEVARVCAPGAHVLAAATWVGVHEEESAWVRRLADVGVHRIEAGSVGNGSWELFDFHP
ncbi:MAG TPA: class I SAM-dependent methyltransferase [Mycobacteriales bacterium]|nr:class I SAM-dependent methyltransferase [Mycobacteriales bacterium]